MTKPKIDAPRVWTVKDYDGMLCWESVVKNPDYWGVASIPCRLIRESDWRKVQQELAAYRKLVQPKRKKRLARGKK